MKTSDSHLATVMSPMSFNVNFLFTYDQRASKSREETAIATVGKLISILHLAAGPRTRNVMMTSQSKKNDFFSSGTNLQMSPL